MIEEIGTAAMEVALLAAFALILGAFAVLLWDLLRGRMGGWPRVVAVVVGAPACALAATVISAGVGWAVASTLGPDEPPPAHIEPAQEDLERTSAEGRGERTSAAEGGRGPETTTERSASPPATPSASPTATATPSASATATASPSP
jgi:hypothetical protein